jgi:hypothetical protein
VEKYVFNSDKYAGMARAGMWRIDIFISKDSVTLRGSQYFILIKEESEE